MRRRLFVPRRRLHAVQQMTKAAPAVQTTKIVKEERARSLLMKSVEAPK